MAHGDVGQRIRHAAMHDAFETIMEIGADMQLHDAAVALKLNDLDSEQIVEPVAMRRLAHS